MKIDLKYILLTAAIGFFSKSMHAHGISNIPMADSPTISTIVDLS